ncbi:hypothetical protein VPH35_100368 [Triticum aestivum]
MRRLRISCVLCLLLPLAESEGGMRFQHLVSELGVLGVRAVPEAWQRWRRSPVAARWSSGPCVSLWRRAGLQLSWRVAEPAGGDVVCTATAEAAEALRGGCGGTVRRSR